MMWFFKTKRRSLIESEQEIEKAIQEKQEEQVKVSAITGRAGRVASALKRERETNHYSERMRKIFRTERRAP